jgi:uncharacterized protein (DUF488 family)
MKIFTIGFTKKNAETFFTRLIRPDLKRLIDIRLNNVSQLAGFTKRDDLKFFLKSICHLEYLHLTELAPSEDILDNYKQDLDWDTYEKRFIALLDQRRVAETLQKELFDGACLLCSEAEPRQCHRRLVAEYLKQKWGDIDIQHL